MAAVNIAAVGTGGGVLEIKMQSQRSRTLQHDNCNDKLGNVEGSNTTEKFGKIKHDGEVKDKITGKNTITMLNNVNVIPEAGIRSPGLCMGTPEPGKGTPEPGKGTPEPGKGTPEPGKGTPEPGKGTPEPGKETPEPGKGTPEPGKGTPEPGKGPPEPSKRPPEPSKGPPEPSKGPPEPSNGPGKGPPGLSKGSHESDMVTPEPGKGTEPDKGTLQPVKGTPEPDKGTPEPDKGTPEPDKGTPEPDKGTHRPSKETPEPSKGSPELDKETPEPGKETPGPEMGIPGPVNASPGPCKGPPGPVEVSSGPGKGPPQIGMELPGLGMGPLRPNMEAPVPGTGHPGPSIEPPGLCMAPPALGVGHAESSVGCLGGSESSMESPGMAPLSSQVMVFYYHAATRGTACEKPQNACIVSQAEWEQDQTNKVHGSAEIGNSDIDAHLFVKNEESSKRKHDRMTYIEFRIYWDIYKKSRPVQHPPKQTEVTEQTKNKTAVPDRKTNCGSTHTKESVCKKGLSDLEVKYPVDAHDSAKKKTSQKLKDRMTAEEYRVYWEEASKKSQPVQVYDHQARTGLSSLGRPQNNSSTVIQPECGIVQNNKDHSSFKTGISHYDACHAANAKKPQKRKVDQPTATSLRVYLDEVCKKFCKKSQPMQLESKQPEVTELTKDKTPDGKSCYYNTHTEPPVWNGPVPLSVLKGRLGTAGASQAQTSVQQNAAVDVRIGNRTDESKKKALELRIKNLTGESRKKVVEVCDHKAKTGESFLGKPQNSSIVIQPECGIVQNNIAYSSSKTGKLGTAGALQALTIVQQNAALEVKIENRSGELKKQVVEVNDHQAKTGVSSLVKPQNSYIVIQPECGVVQNNIAHASSKTGKLGAAGVSQAQTSVQQNAALVVKIETDNRTGEFKKKVVEVCDHKAKTGESSLGKPQNSSIVIEPECEIVQNNIVLGSFDTGKLGTAGASQVQISVQQNTALDVKIENITDDSKKRLLEVCDHKAKTGESSLGKPQNPSIVIEPECGIVHNIALGSSMTGRLGTAEASREQTSVQQNEVLDVRIENRTDESKKKALDVRIENRTSELKKNVEVCDHKTKTGESSLAKPQNSSIVIQPECGIVQNNIALGSCTTGISSLEAHHSAKKNLPQKRKSYHLAVDESRVYWNEVYKKSQQWPPFPSTNPGFMGFYQPPPFENMPQPALPNVYIPPLHLQHGQPVNPPAQDVWVENATNTGQWPPFPSTNPGFMGLYQPPPFGNMLQPALPNVYIPPLHLQHGQPVNQPAEDVWVENATDTGQVYYYSIKTSVSTWVRPKNVQIITQAELEIALINMTQGSVDTEAEMEMALISTAQGSVETEKSECDTHLSVKNETSRNENIFCQIDQGPSSSSYQKYDNAEDSEDIKLPKNIHLMSKEVRNFWDAAHTKFQHVQQPLEEITGSSWPGYNVPSPGNKVNHQNTCPEESIGNKSLLEEKLGAARASQAQTSVQQNAALDVIIGNRTDESKKKVVRLKSKWPEGTKLTKHKTPDSKSYYYNTHTDPPVWNGPVPLSVLKGKLGTAGALQEQTSVQQNAAIDVRIGNRTDESGRKAVDVRIGNRTGESRNKALDVGKNRIGESKKKALELRIESLTGESRKKVVEEKKNQPEVVKDEKAEQKAVKKSGPVASTPVSGTDWCVVRTNDGRCFFYNPSKRQSVWKRPEELKNRLDVDQLLIPKPEGKIEHKKEKFVQEEPPAKKIK